MGAFHGGAFWDAIDGDIAGISDVVRADVLDAWFPPAPGVLFALSRHLATICNTSPEIEARCLAGKIAEWRGLPPESIVVGAGSSSLIYLALPYLLRGCKTAATLHPTYSEYPYQIEDRIGLRLCRMPVSAPLDDLLGSDALVLPNPNSPTGTTLDIQSLIDQAPPETRIWIDETYVEYAGAESVEKVAAERLNTIVLKSLSKSLALSGLRVGYLVAHPDLAREIREQTPPWPICLPAQVAARAAIEDPHYYRNRYDDTRSACHELAESLGARATKINCALLSHPRAAELAELLREENVFIRQVDETLLRVAVRPRPEMWKLVRAFHRVLPQVEQTASR